MSMLLSLATAMSLSLVPDRLILTTGSRHINMNGFYHDFRFHPFREKNPGIGLVYENRAGGLDYTIGTYRGSYRQCATFAHVSKMFPVLGEGPWAIHAGPFIGIAHYGQDAQFIESRIGNSSFVGIAGLQFRSGPFFLTATPMPNAAGKPALLVGFGLSTPLN